MEHLALGGNDNDWKQSSQDLASAIQHLLDGTHHQQQLHGDIDGDDDTLHLVSSGGDEVEVGGGERVDRLRTRTRTVSEGAFLRPGPMALGLERRGSATYGDFERDVLLRTPRKEEGRYSPYHRA